MNCSYVRQTSEFSKFFYLDHPDQFDIVPDDSTCYKNIIFLTDPEEDEKDFYVYSLGFEVSDPSKALINRIYSTRIVLHYIVGGEGTFNGHTIRPGDCVIAFNNRLHSLCTNPSNTLRFYWIMLKVPDSFDPSVWGLDKSCEIFSYNFENQMKRIFDEMLHFYSETQNVYYFFLSKFYELISYHKQDGKSNRVIPKNSSYSQYVSLAKNMWAQSVYKLSVEDVAHFLGFSRKYFSLIFMEETGISPQKYIVEHRIEMAKLYIDAGEINLKKIALQLGYSDYSSFYRTFKQKTGLSPHEYLNQVKGSSSGKSNKTENTGHK